MLAPVAGVTRDVPSKFRAYAPFVYVVISVINVTTWTVSVKEADAVTGAGPVVHSIKEIPVMAALPIVAVLTFAGPHTWASPVLVRSGDPVPEPAAPQVEAAAAPVLVVQHIQLLELASAPDTVIVPPRAGVKVSRPLTLMVSEPAV